MRPTVRGPAAPLPNPRTTTRRGAITSVPSEVSSLSIMRPGPSASARMPLTARRAPGSTRCSCPSTVSTSASGVTTRTSRYGASSAVYAAAAPIPPIATRMVSYAARASVAASRTAYAATRASASTSTSSIAIVPPCRASTPCNVVRQRSIPDGSAGAATASQTGVFRDACCARRASSCATSESRRALTRAITRTGKSDARSCSSAAGGPETGSSMAIRGRRSSRSSA